MEFFEQVYRKKPKMAGGSDRTPGAYKPQVNWLNRFFCLPGEPARDEAGKEVCRIRPADLTVDLIADCMEWRHEAGSSNATCNGLRAVARALWKEAHKKGFHGDPPGEVEKYRKLKREPVCWSIEEFEQILAAASELAGWVGPFPRSTWLLALLWTVYNSGGRISAVMSIRWDWIDLGEQRLVIEPEVQKDKEGQVVTLQSEVVEALAELRQRRSPGVFDDWPYDRTQWGWPALNKLLREVIVSAGLRPSVDRVSRRDLWHKIRRVFATYVTKEAGIEVACDLLGHCDVSITWGYVDKSKLDRQSQATLLPKLKPHRHQLRVRKFDEAG